MSTSSRMFFVSYSSKDAHQVIPVVQLVRATGVQVFRDEDDLKPGDRWRDILAHTLFDADVIIVFWSKNSACSPNVAFELREGIRLGKGIIPIILDDVPLTDDLLEFQHIDFRRVWELGDALDNILRGMADSVREALGIQPIPQNRLIRSSATDVFVANTSNAVSEGMGLGDEILMSGLTAAQWNLPKSESALLCWRTFRDLLTSRVVLLIFTSADACDRRLRGIGGFCGVSHQLFYPVLVDCETNQLPPDVARVKTFNWSDRHKLICALVTHLNSWRPSQ